MKHHEKMKWLKENDPMTYYEMTSDPTGADGDSYDAFSIIAITAIIVVLIIVLAIIF